MSPKKALVIILALFFIIVMVFAYLYYIKLPMMRLGEQPAGNLTNNSDNNVSTSTDSRAELIPVEQKIEAIETTTNKNVEQIMEQGQTASGGITVEAQRDIEDAVNQEIAEKIKLKTPEQIKADEERRAELDKIEQEINQQIIDQLQTQ